MPINLTDQAKQDVASKGGLVDGSVASGDLSGTFPAPTVSSISGQTLPSSGFAAGTGIVHDGTSSFVNAVLVTENSSYGGDVSGNQAGGLTVARVDGVPIEVSGITSGQVLKFNGTNITGAADSGGFTTVSPKTANYTQVSNKEMVPIGTIASAITITLKGSEVLGDELFLDATSASGISPTNTITIVGDSGTPIAGDATGVQIQSNLAIRFYFDGTEHKYILV